MIRELSARHAASPLTIDVVRIRPHVGPVPDSTPAPPAQDLDARAAALGQVSNHALATLADAAAALGLAGHPSLDKLRDALTLPERIAAVAAVRKAASPQPPPAVEQALLAAEEALARLDALVDEASARDRSLDAPTPATAPDEDGGGGVKYPRIDVVRAAPHRAEVPTEIPPAVWQLVVDAGTSKAGAKALRAAVTGYEITVAEFEEASRALDIRRRDAAYKRLREIDGALVTRGGDLATSQVVLARLCGRTQETLARGKHGAFPTGFRHDLRAWLVAYACGEQPEQLAKRQGQPVVAGSSAPKLTVSAEAREALEVWGSKPALSQTTVVGWMLDRWLILHPDGSPLAPPPPFLTRSTAQGEVAAAKKALLVARRASTAADGSGDAAASRRAAAAVTAAEGRLATAEQALAEIRDVLPIRVRVDPGLLKRFDRRIGDIARRTDYLRVAIHEGVAVLAAHEGDDLPSLPAKRKPLARGAEAVAAAP